VKGPPPSPARSVSGPLVLPHVVVVGAGIAGAGAAMAAANAGVRVTAIDGGTGASTLATGAIDGVPSPGNSERAGLLSGAVKAALDALGGYVVAERATLVLTTAGIVRPALGRDAALLDVAHLGRERVGVVQCHRPAWDARALARAWGDTYSTIDATALRHVDERVIPDADFAARHDDAARLGWLAERLREAIAREGGSWGALVLPPSLGIERARADALSTLAGVPCGEPVAMPGGPSGLRFERARDRALGSVGVELVRARATKIERAGDAWRVSTDEGTTWEGDAVVLATGGLLGGGLEYAPSEHVEASALPPFARTPLRLTVSAPLVLGTQGRPLELPSSLFGVGPEALAWPFVRDGLLDRAGVLVDDDGAGLGAPGRLYAAGETVADAPRTWLASLASGVGAGSSAARDALTGPRRSAGASPREAPASRP
jgi:glycerol-3-phosphate dehydrogenase subunit B